MTMLSQDMQTFTLVDNGVGSILAPDDSTISANSIETREDDNRSYKDYGVAYFSGDMFFDFSSQIVAVDIPAPGPLWKIIGITNNAVDFRSEVVANYSSLSVYCYNPDVGDTSVFNVYLREQYPGSAIEDVAINSASYDVGVTNQLFYDFEVDSTVGTYGTCYLYIYDSNARTTLLDTLVLTLNATPSFRYFVVYSSYPTNPGSFPNPPQHESTATVRVEDLRFLGTVYPWLQNSNFIPDFMSGLGVVEA